MVYDAARAAVFMNRRDTEPYVRWCGRTAEGNLRLLPDTGAVPRTRKTDLNRAIPRCGRVGDSYQSADRNTDTGPGRSTW